MFISMLIFYLDLFKWKGLFFLSTYLTTFGAFMNLKTRIELLVLSFKCNKFEVFSNHFVNFQKINLITHTTLKQILRKYIYINIKCSHT